MAELANFARPQQPPTIQGGNELPSRYLNKEDEPMLSARKMFEQLFGYEDPTMIEQLQAFGKVFRTREGASSTFPTMRWCGRKTPG